MQLSGEVVPPRFYVIRIHNLESEELRNTFSPASAPPSGLRARAALLVHLLLKHPRRTRTLIPSGRRTATPGGRRTVVSAPTESKDEGKPPGLNPAARRKACRRLALDRVAALAVLALCGRHGQGHLRGTKDAHGRAPDCGDRSTAGTVVAARTTSRRTPTCESMRRETFSASAASGSSRAIVSQARAGSELARPGH